MWVRCQFICSHEHHAETTTCEGSENLTSRDAPWVLRLLTRWGFLHHSSRNTPFFVALVDEFRATIPSLSLQVESCHPQFPVVYFCRTAAFAPSRASFSRVNWTSCAFLSQPPSQFLLCSLFSSCQGGHETGQLGHCVHCCEQAPNVKDKFYFHHSTL